VGEKDAAEFQVPFPSPSEESYRNGGEDRRGFSSRPSMLGKGNKSPLKRFEKHIVRQGVTKWEKEKENGRKEGGKQPSFCGVQTWRVAKEESKAVPEH